jgi:L-asparaginase II
MQMAAQAPLTVEVTRGNFVESSHLVHAVVMNGLGETIAAYGNPRRLTYPRSSLKPLQALALIEGGGPEEFGMSEAEIALACASHSGEDIHTTTAATWLKRLGTSDAELECGAHAPYANACSPATVLCNNCSGKHTGMLTLARLMKVPTKGYVDVMHPVQQKILGVMSEMCGDNLTPADCGVDGCSAPNPAMPLEDLARGFARFMNPATANRARAEACKRIFRAMTAHPDLVAGTGRIDTILMRAAKGKILTKIGGEAVHIAVIPEKDTVLALKAEDGAGRAVQAALCGLLEKYKLADADVLEATKSTAFPTLKNWRGIEVGVIRMGKA